MRVALDVQTSLALFARIFEYLDLRPAIVELARRPDDSSATAHVRGRDRALDHVYVPLPRAAELIVEDDREPPTQPADADADAVRDGDG